MTIVSHKYQLTSPLKTNLPDGQHHLREEGADDKREDRVERGFVASVFFHGKG